MASLFPPFKYKGNSIPLLKLSYINAISIEVILSENDHPSEHCDSLT